MTALYKYGTLLLLLFSLAASAQPRVEARLNPVARDSFYKVELGSDLTRYTRPDFGDLRLWDERGAPVPYRVVTNTGISTFSFLVIPIARVEEDSTSTSTTFRIPAIPSSGFEVNFANTKTQRRATLTGSNDGIHWYSFTDSFLLTPKPEGTGIASASLSYPASNFRYIRLQVHNGRAAPLHLLQAGILMGNPYPEDWLTGMRLPFREEVRGHQSIFRIDNARHALLERLDFSISHPKQFTRNVTLRDDQGRELAFGVLMNFQSGFTFPATQAASLQLVVENGDNPRLQVDSIVATQRSHLLLAYLEKGHTYRLEAGDSTARRPNYDLSGLTDSARWTAATLTYGPLRKLAVKQSAKSSDNRLWLWLALVAGVAVLIAVSVSLLRESGTSAAS